MLFIFKALSYLKDLRGNTVLYLLYENDNFIIVFAGLHEVKYAFTKEFSIAFNFSFTQANGFQEN